MEAGLNASLELQCRETMEIRTKHLGAGFEAGFKPGLKGLKAIEIGANWPPTVRAMGILVGHSSATLFFDN